jgi:hypothetical protein
MNTTALTVQIKHVLMMSALMCVLMSALQYCKNAIKVGREFFAK